MPERDRLDDFLREKAKRIKVSDEHIYELLKKIWRDQRRLLKRIDDDLRELDQEEDD